MLSTNINIFKANVSMKFSINSNIILNKYIWPINGTLTSIIQSGAILSPNPYTCIQSPDDKHDYVVFHPHVKVHKYYFLKETELPSQLGL